MDHKTQLARQIKIRNQLKAQYDTINKETKAVKKELDDAEHAILGTLNEMQIDAAKVDNVTVTRTVQHLYNVTDWDAMHQYIIENNAMYLLQRRIIQPAVQELVEHNEPLPVELFEKQKLSIRKV